MIKYVKRKHLNDVKYNACVVSSKLTKVYGFSWYLDLVASNWDALVLEDYKAVMPIIWNKKYGIKYINQPYFCQQITIYSAIKLNDFLIKLFFKNIPKSILFTNLNFSYKLPFYNTTTKQNFILNLNNEYQNLYNAYRKDRKKSLKKAQQNKLTYKDFNNKTELISLYKNVFSFLKMPNTYFKKIETIIEYCLQNNLGFIRNIYKNNNIVCIGFFLKYNAKIYYLFAASSKEGKNYGATTFLLDSVIKEFSKTNAILEFEGSTIKSIASFYKSFGSQLTYYYNYKTNAVKRIFL